MKTIKTVLLIILTITLFSSCDSNEDNNATTVCDANFYTMSSTHWDSVTGTFDINQYQKSQTLSQPNTLSSTNNFTFTSGILTLINTAINSNLGEIVYHFSETPNLYKFNINNNTMSISTFHGWKNPEYLGNSLHFLKTNNTIMQSGFLQTADCMIVDEAGNDVSQVLSNIDFSNSGSVNRSYFMSTSNNQDKLYYLANSKLIIYNQNTNSWNDYLLETYNETTNKIIFKGLEYVDDNTLYVLKGDITDPNNVTLKLMKIDLSSTTPQVALIKDLTNSLSLSASEIIGSAKRDWINSSYDICDDNYYFTFSDWSTIDATIFEIKLITNIINEYPINGRLLYGFDKD